MGLHMIILMLCMSEVLQKKGPTHYKCRCTISRCPRHYHVFVCRSSSVYSLRYINFTLGFLFFRFQWLIFDIKIEMKALKYVNKNFMQTQAWSGSKLLPLGIHSCPSWGFFGYSHESVNYLWKNKLIICKAIWTQFLHSVKFQKIKNKTLIN